MERSPHRSPNRRIVNHGTRHPIDRPLTDLSGETPTSNGTYDLPVDFPFRLSMRWLIPINLFD
jgi:hypothetical protein